MINFSVLAGVLAAVATIGGTLLMSTMNSNVFLNTHAMLIVVGGTLAATLLCFPISSLAKMIMVLFRKVLFRRGQTAQEVIAEITDLARGYRLDPEYLKLKSKDLKTPFLVEAIEMINSGGIPKERIGDILRKRSRFLFQKYEEEAQIFKVISKFPPAFGLMGTTIGMIGLMHSMGNEDAMNAIGPAMGIALVATFYGIAFANLLFIPMGEHLAKLNRQEAVLRKIVIDGVLMLHEKQHHLLVTEDLKSYLMPGERLKMTEAPAAEKKAA
jgi:chemotaxis protein MotA